MFDLEKIIASIPDHDQALRECGRESIPVILAACETYGVVQPNRVAYLLATAEHESRLGYWMEELASGWDYEGWAEELGNTEPGDGPKFKGRGFVQLTGRRNYADWSDRLGLDLISNPEQVSEPTIAAKVLVQGSLLGTFTGYTLGGFFSDSVTDFYGARRIINGLDRANHIASIAQAYLNVL